MNASVRPVLSVLAVVGGSLLLGGMTSWAQSVLPDALASFANSPSGWAALTVLLVAAVRPSLPWGGSARGGLVRCVGVGLHRRV